MIVSCVGVGTFPISMSVECNAICSGGAGWCFIWMRAHGGVSGEPVGSSSINREKNEETATTEESMEEKRIDDLTKALLQAQCEATVIRLCLRVLHAEQEGYEKSYILRDLRAAIEKLLTAWGVKES